jgi:hypothetical protein
MLLVEGVVAGDTALILHTCQMIALTGEREEYFVGSWRLVFGCSAYKSAHQLIFWKVDRRNHKNP